MIKLVVKRTVLVSNTNYVQTRTTPIKPKASVNPDTLRLAFEDGAADFLHCNLPLEAHRGPELAGRRTKGLTVENIHHCVGIVNDLHKVCGAVPLILDDLPKTVFVKI